MEPLRLSLENFMGHRATDIDCTLFNSALIVGKSKNDGDRVSNGAGKSTIFKAIEYVLFGEYETKSIDKLVRNGQDRARVTFDFTLGIQTFRVQRTRNRKSSKSDLRMWEKQGDTWKDVSQKTSTEVENELSKLIKISHQAFRNSVLFAQSDVEGLSSTKSPEKRKLILKEALNLAIYGKYEKLTKEKLSELSKNIIARKALINALGKPNVEISILKSKLQEIRNALESVTAQQLVTTQSMSDKKLLVAELQKIASSEAGEAQNKLREIAVTIQQQLIAVEKSNKMLTQKQQLLLQLKSQHEAKNIDLRSLEREHQNLKTVSSRSVEVVKKDLDAVSTNEYNGKLYISSSENKLKDLQKPFPTGSQCPQCRQTVGQEHRTACLAQISTDIQTISNDISQKKKILESIRIKKDKLIQELSDISANSVKIGAYYTKIESKKSEIQRDVEYITQIDNLVVYLKNDNQSQLSTLSELRAKELELKQNLQDIDIDTINSKIADAVREVSELEHDLRGLVENVSSFNTQCGIVSEKISEKESSQIRLNQLETDLKALEKDYQIKQIVAQGFGSGGIPTIIIYTILDDLQVEANKLLSELRPGLELQFSVTKSKADGQQEDTLDITYRLDGNELDNELLSGGQKLLIALSLRIGLSLVIQHRLGVDIKFLELDEVDQGLDEAGVEAFVNVIKKLQDKLKIFIITHNKNIKDKFAHAILVEHDKVNGSTARVVDSW